MSKIPTAEQFIENQACVKVPESERGKMLFTFEEYQRGLIKFGQICAQAALEAAADKAERKCIGHHQDEDMTPIYGVDKDSILNAYPLTNIK